MFATSSFVSVVALLFTVSFGIAESYPLLWRDCNWGVFGQCLETKDENACNSRLAWRCYSTYIDIISLRRITPEGEEAASETCFLPNLDSNALETGVDKKTAEGEECKKYCVEYAETEEGQSSVDKSYPELARKVLAFANCWEKIFSSWHELFKVVGGIPRITEPWEREKQPQ